MIKSILVVGAIMAAYKLGRWVEEDWWHGPNGVWWKLRATMYEVSAASEEAGRADELKQVGR